MDAQGKATGKGELDESAARRGRGPDREFKLNEGSGRIGGGWLAVPVLSAPPEEGLVAEAVLATEAGGGRWMLIELREPVLALGLGVVSSVGHGGHHATVRGRCEIWLRGSVGRLH